MLSDDRYFKNFKLKLPSSANNEKNKFDKLKYEMLGEYKNTFDILRTVRSVVIKQNEPDDDSSIYDLNIRYTFVENDNIFVNIMLQNARLFKNGIVIRSI